MALTLSSRWYRSLDWGSKLLGVLAIAAGLQHAVGALSPLAILVGLGLGLTTVFVDIEE